MGKIVPVLCQPVIPGDKWSVQTNFLLRLNPLFAPIMHRMDVYFHAFFVPNRLVWDNWEDFITRGTDGKDMPVLPYCTPMDMYQFLAIDYLHNPEKVDPNDFVSSLPDYMGLPVEMFKLEDAGTKISLLPFRGYQLIYNEYYRDETLSDEINILSDQDGATSYTDALAELLTLRNRAWKKDYFTGSLPWPQRLANAEVTLPIAGQANIIKDGDFTTPYESPYSGDNLLQNTTGGSSSMMTLEIDGSGFLKAKNYKGSLHDSGINLNAVLSDAQIKHLKADLSTGNSVTINQLREAVRLQMWLENNARGGSRYTEQLLAHFGVKSKDSRLQRPEYLGGFSSPVNISEVIQTSETTDSSAQGNQSGHGFALNSGRTIKRYFDEHGYLFVLMSIRPQPAYFQGIPKDFTKMDNLDFYFPEFQHLGEQPILERELYYSGNDSDEKIFGYVPRYSEYKYIGNRVCGDFRTNMDYYHLARKFSAAPNLNGDFIKCDETADDMSRIFNTIKDAETGKQYQHFWFDVAHSIRCSRKMSKYGIPKLL